MDNTNSPAPVYINWGDIPLSPLEQLLADTRQFNHVVAQAFQDGRMRDHPFNNTDTADYADTPVSAPVHSAGMVPGTLPGAAPVPLTVQETAPVQAAGMLPGTATDPASATTDNVVTPKRPRGRPRTFDSKYPQGDPRRKAESVARSRAKRRAGVEAIFDISRVGLMVEAGAGDHIAGSPLADLWSRIVDLNGMMQTHVNNARFAQDKLSQLCAEYEAQYPLGKVWK